MHGRPARVPVHANTPWEGRGRARALCQEAANAPDGNAERHARREDVARVPTIAEQPLGQQHPEVPSGEAAEKRLPAELQEAVNRRRGHLHDVSKHQAESGKDGGDQDPAGHDEHQVLTGTPLPPGESPGGD